MPASSLHGGPVSTGADMAAVRRMPANIFPITHYVHQILNFAMAPLVHITAMKSMSAHRV